MVLAGVWEKRHRRPGALRPHAPWQSSPAPSLKPAQTLAAIANPSTAFLDLRLRFLEDAPLCWYPVTASGHFSIRHLVRENYCSVSQIEELGSERGSETWPRACC